MGDRDADEELRASPDAIARALGGSETDAALMGYRLATAAAELAFRRHEAREARCLIWDRYMSALYAAYPHYQAQDFEIVDYELTRLNGAHLLRGPLPDPEDLERGNYVCLVGAAQLFGRFHRDSLQHMLSRDLGVPVLNLSGGGVGPDVFLDEALRPYLERARLCVVEVMSGRSVGCDEFPGGYETIDPATGDHVPRTTLLSKIWSADPARCEELISRWNALYLQKYEALAARIPGPKILLWVSPRRPGEWSPEIGRETGRFGTFPQLVGADIVARIAPFFDCYVEVVHAIQELRFTSRFTSDLCPFFDPDGRPNHVNRYYPPQITQEHMVRRIAPVARSLLGRAPSPPRPQPLRLIADGRTLPLWRDDSGEVCFRPEAGKADKPAFVLSIQKAGTYLMAGMLSSLGWQDCEIHMGPHELTDYRGVGIEDRLSTGRQRSFPLAFAGAVLMMKSGQFSVGHIPFTQHHRNLLRAVRTVLLVRRWRDCLASYMDFERKRLAADPLRLPPERTEWTRRPTLQEQFVGYLEALGGPPTKNALTMVPWQRQPGILVVRFEALRGEEGPDAQDSVIGSLLEHLGQPVTDDLVSVVRSCIGQPSATFSKGRPGIDELWSPEAAVVFRDLEGPAVETRFGYRRPRSV